MLADADVIFNRSVSFNSYRGALSSNGVIDFRRVAAHEFGHVLGLGPPDEAGQNVEAIMNSAVSNVEVPQSDDIDGIQALCGGASAPTPAPAPAPPIVVNFPPRNESFDCGTQLDAKYRDGLKRAPVSSYVNLEGDAVWTQEYLRFRVNGCSHANAVQSVFGEISGTSQLCHQP